VLERPRAAIPWLLVVGSALLAVLVGYLLFGAYLPAKQHVARLEAELRDVYAREAALHKRVAELEEQHGQRDRQLSALRAERSVLARRVAELEQALGRRRPAPPPRRRR
jgi:septal ring factor EnvC (AmiA/AmiB activator)